MPTRCRRSAFYQSSRPPDGAAGLPRRHRYRCLVPAFERARRDIKPQSPVTGWLTREGLTDDQLHRSFDVDLAAALAGMSRSYIARAFGHPGGRPRTLTLEQVLHLLELDDFQETFVPRSRIPQYLLSRSESEPHARLGLKEDVTIVQGDALSLIPRLDPASVRCVVTSSPYWGMRLYDNLRDVEWADGERCPYGFEQTPEGFIRHTIEFLHALRPVLTKDASIWWNLMDTYNTRTPIRGNARERLEAMNGKPDYLRGWTEHYAVRHSAGHAFLDDGEQASIPWRVAERASRIGYRLKSVITWRKDWSVPEPVKSRVSRQAEYVLQLAIGRPIFNKLAWQQLPPRLGGANPQYESEEKITDVWCLPTSPGKNGHGAEFPLALPGRCIALSTEPGDLVLDPFIGSGTTALAALRLNRHCVGFDTSTEYVQLATDRLAAARTCDIALWDGAGAALETLPENSSSRNGGCGDKHPGLQPAKQVEAPADVLVD
jgi:DNA modification methylase